MTEDIKESIANQIVDSLKSEPEVKKIIIFGSFFSSDFPEDLDIAVFQDTNEDGLKLGMKYRRRLLTVARQIPLDVFPVRISGETEEDPMLREINRGRIVYES